MIFFLFLFISCSTGLTAWFDAINASSITTNTLSFKNNGDYPQVYPSNTLYNVETGIQFVLNCYDQETGERGESLFGIVSVMKPFCFLYVSDLSFGENGVYCQNLPYLSTYDSSSINPGGALTSDSFYAGLMYVLVTENQIQVVPWDDFPEDSISMQVDSFTTWYLCDVINT